MQVKSLFSQIWQSDPRHYQIMIQSCLLVYGLFWLDFEIELLGVLTIISTALLTQFFCLRFFKVPRFDFRSPLASALSLCLLLRTNILLLMSITVAITILSKFIFRWKNKQIYRISILIAVLFAAPIAHSFCGFYVAKADARLFNKASQVVIVRHDDKTVMTMANDFKGDPKEFAVVIPVPTFINEGQIHVGDKKIIEHLDAYTAPRLVEYFDENPCYHYPTLVADMLSMPEMEAAKREKSHGVTVEAEYTVGEYDFVILSATESEGLEIWLKENGYRIPDGAARVLGSYIKQKMRFFVAKVNFKEQSKLGFNYLRPISVAYESSKFMLPIRLGTVNAQGAQELFVYALTRRGRVETTNYRTVKLPTGMDLPVYIKNEFGDFYRALFDQQVKAERMKTVFLEYAWDMNWCDPCAADPLSVRELRELGVFWISETERRSQAIEVFVTRLHLRYTADSFPEDLVFHETADSSNFQGRYVLRHAWTGTDDCSAAEEYRRNLRRRQEEEAQRLASLTGWDVSQIREKMGIVSSIRCGEKIWWQRIWGE
ncbi:MAG: DUF2330 domain-containing protein [Pseudomonadota bacterium]